MERLGAYTADRASALSGVPKSTIHYWDRTGVLKPGVSRSKTKLWSYADLMGLRVIYWLRSRKDEPDGVAIPPSSMGAVRAALLQLEAFDVELWAKDAGAGLSVDRAGRIVVNPKDSAPVINWQMLLGIDVIELTGPFPTKSGSLVRTYESRGHDCGSSRESSVAPLISPRRELRPSHLRLYLTVGFASQTCSRCTQGSRHVTSTKPSTSKRSSSVTFIEARSPRRPTRHCVHTSHCSRSTRTSPSRSSRPWGTICRRPNWSRCAKSMLACRRWRTTGGSSTS